MAKLRIKDENGKERVHELIDDVTSIGRASSNVIQVSDEKASRQHFRVDKDATGFKVVDLGSTNGTKLNGLRIESDTHLRPGDQLSLGKTTFIYEDEQPKAEPAPVPVPASSGAETMEMDPMPASMEPARAGPKFVLKVLEGKNPGTTYELGVSALTIGRHNSSTIQIIDEAASNFHAEINKEPIGYVLSDLGSTNGTRVRQKYKTEFEKVVKTPLSAGMQIRVGKTLLEFENVGSPVEDEALFGTVSLDPQKLEEKLSHPRGVPTSLLAVLALIVFVGVVSVVIYIARPNTDPGPLLPPVTGTGNLVQNGDFDDGTDDEANPRYFRIVRGAPGIRVEVKPEADHGGVVAADPNNPNAPVNKSKGLQISKNGAKSPSTTTFVESSDSFPVDAGKTYELKGAMRNDGDGLFGLRITWIQGERSFSENPIVLKDTQEWKTKSIQLTPPSWAQRARVGAFVQGKEGRACFDKLSFTERPGAPHMPHPSVKFAGIAVNFEGTKSEFSAECQGERVLEEGTLLLVSPDGTAISELASAINPQNASKPSETAFTGTLYDFVLQDLAGYKIQALQGATGVDVSAAINATSDTGSRPQLRFYVIGPTAQGDIEVSKPGGETERILAVEDKTLNAAQGILFNAGKAPQLDVSFARPVEVEIKREGNRRRVTVKFKGEVRLALAPESVAQKQKMAQALADLQKTMEAKQWGEAETKLKAYRDGFAARFPQAKEDYDAIQLKLDAEWKDVQVDIQRALSGLQIVPSGANANTAVETVNRHRVKWRGVADKEAELSENLKRIDAIRQAGEGTEVEKKAEGHLREAQSYYDRKVYNVAISILKVKIVNDPELSKTKAAEKAKQLLQQAEATQQKQDDINRIQDKLREKIKAFEGAKDYKGAIEKIEKDAEYQQYKNELPEIDAKLNDLKRKLQMGQ